ncbi:hypothetical protein M405DRAFT_844409 [Rhizopogon salebrosus TDB-379]|nr:hypothetical protein M405DRAFT_844409 [Rhizopogon salebrosus TDB-379]
MWCPEGRFAHEAGNLSPHSRERGSYTRMRSPQGTLTHAAGNLSPHRCRRGSRPMMGVNNNNNNNNNNNLDTTLTHAAGNLHPPDSPLTEPSSSQMHALLVHYAVPSGNLHPPNASAHRANAFLTAVSSGSLLQQNVYSPKERSSTQQYISHHAVPSVDIRSTDHPATPLRLPLYALIAPKVHYPKPVRERVPMRT